VSDDKLVPNRAQLTPVQAAELAQTAGDAAEFIRAARSANTLKAYKHDWAQFVAWVEKHGLKALPADPRMVALWLSHMARRLERKPSSIKRMLTTISVMHRRAGLPNPTDAEIVREELRGIQNTLGTRPKRAAPLLIAHLEGVIGSMGTDIRAVRNRAIVLVGWSGAMRRSELAALQAEDVAFLDRGARVLIGRSKTDQKGAGEYVALFYATRTALCPVKALQAWLREAHIERGPLFRRMTRSRSRPLVLSGAMPARQVDYVVRRCTAKAGVQPEQLGDTFSAHSLRAGFITEAARKGKPEWSIARQSRHKSADVLRSYIRVADVFSDNAGEDLL